MANHLIDVKYLKKKLSDPTYFTKDQFDRVPIQIIGRMVIVSFVLPVLTSTMSRTQASLYALEVGTQHSVQAHEVIAICSNK